MYKNLFFKLKIIAFLLMFILIWVFLYIEITYLKVENITTNTDFDNDWINDIDDILEWARREVKNKTHYKSTYYSWWFPPENEWVCTDVLWRALKNAWIDFKKLIDDDIEKNFWNYRRIEWKADPNIDFRRVPNVDVFFKNNSLVLTNDLIPWDKENLKNWQPWDIVTFWAPQFHVAILSDKRNKNWVPYIVHSPYLYPREDDWLYYWHNNISPIIGHYRWKY